MDAGRALAGLRRGCLPVFCADHGRPVGRVEGWLTSPEQGRQLLVRSGWWAPATRRVPLSDIVRADSRGVLLRLDREHFVNQPQYVPDEELGLVMLVPAEPCPPGRYVADDGNRTRPRS